jgi:hypothetical protein
VETSWQAGTVEFVAPGSMAETNVEQRIEALWYVIIGHTPVEGYQDKQTSAEGSMIDQ